METAPASSGSNFAPPHLDSNCVAYHVIKYCHDELKGPELGYGKWQLPTNYCVEGAPQRDEIFDAGETNSERSEPREGVALVDKLRSLLRSSSSLLTHLSTNWDVGCS